MTAGPSCLPVCRSLPFLPRCISSFIRLRGWSFLPTCAQMICMCATVPIDEVLEDDLVAFDLLLRVGLDLLEAIARLWVFELVLHLKKECPQSADFLLSGAVVTSRYSCWLWISSLIDSYSSVPICFCMRSFFCLILWIFTRHSSDIFSKADPFLLTKPRLRSSYIYG